MLFRSILFNERNPNVWISFGTIMPLKIPAHGKMTALHSVNGFTIFQNPWGTAISSQLCITIQSSLVWQIRFRLRQRKGLMRSYRRCGMKKTDDAPMIARRISEFLCDYAPQFLTGSEHTLKGYKDSLVLYFQFLQENGVSPECLSRTHAITGSHPYAGFSNTLPGKTSAWLTYIRMPKGLSARSVPKRKYLG